MRSVKPSLCHKAHIKTATHIIIGFHLYGHLPPGLATLTTLSIWPHLAQGFLSKPARISVLEGPIKMKKISLGYSKEGIMQDSPWDGILFFWVIILWY